MSATAEEYKVDRSNWTPGPWDKEQEDKREWRHNGLPCMMVRNHMGAWCGYVGVSKEHPLYGLSYTGEGSDKVDELSVHGGITYGDKCQGPICHVPQPGESDDIWWLGFDCAHGFDIIPGMVSNTFRFSSNLFDGYTDKAAAYRDIAYVVTETEKLADQLKAAA